MKQDLETEITNMEQPDLEKVKEIVERRLFSIEQDERIRDLQNHIKRLKEESFEDTKVSSRPVNCGDNYYDNR